jgi:hypothetical protein
MRNLQSKVPDDVWPEFKARAAASFQAASPALARLLRDDIASTYARDLPSAVACLDDDFEACIAQLRFPLGHRRAIRTTNLLERLFGEARRRGTLSLREAAQETGEDSSDHEHACCGEADQSKPNHQHQPGQTQDSDHQH